MTRHERAIEIRSWAEENLPTGDRGRYFIGELTTLVLTSDDGPRLDEEDGR